MRFVYVLYGHKRMILEEIAAASILEADKIMNTLMTTQIDKRNDIGCYPAHLFPKQYLDDLNQNFCSH